MSTANLKVIPISAGEASKQRAALDRDVDGLIDVFRELHEVEKLTGRAGLSARVRVAFANILRSADKAAYT